MGWTHDYNDVARTRRTTSGMVPHPPGGASKLQVVADPRVGIPRILRRRARWVSVRLRHTRG
ncbi:hypothetical protein [Streptomyces ziwulingensis]|uniref:Transposase n=1 Tax=Streptomyces ziwulingensis TaxID=1045501 RepID=A0ABP9BM43_9ACTN